MWIALLLLSLGNLTLGFGLGMRLIRWLDGDAAELDAGSDVVTETAEEAGLAEPEAAPPEPAPPQGKPAEEQALELFSHLQSWMSGVDSNIGVHTSRIEALGEEFKVCAASDPAMAIKLIAQIVETNGTLQQELHAAKRELREQEQELQSRTSEARTDALTGTANRRALDEMLVANLDESTRSGRPLSLLMFDVDHFKKFNDTHGHQAGDAVLRQVAEVLATAAGSLSPLARYGGEEFALLLPDVDGAQAALIAENLRLAVADRTFPFEDQALRVTVSVGVAQAVSTDDPTLLTRRADSALYAAKAGGRNRGFISDGPTCKPIRRSERHQVESVQLIAYLNDDELPGDDAFHAVKCHDISTGGFSYLAAQPPAIQRLVIRLGTQQARKDMTAVVANVNDLGKDAPLRYRIGCRFVGRFAAGSDGKVKHHELEEAAVGEPRGAAAALSV